MTRMPANPHDHYFKLSFGQPEQAAELVARYLPPEVAEAIDLTSLERQAGSFVDEGLRGHQGDLLFHARLQAGGEAGIYLLFEHKRERNRLVSLQLLRYCVRIWERDQRERPGSLPRPVVPLVIYNGRAGWQAPRFEDLFAGPEALRQYWPRFHFDLLDLASLPEDEIVGEVRVRVALLALRAMWRPAPRRQLERIAALLAEIEERSTAVGMLQALVRYAFWSGDELDEDDVYRAAEAALPTIGGEQMATIAERLLARGRAEGEARGRIEGLRAGLRAMLASRFGQDGLALMPAIEAIDDPLELEALLPRIAEAPDLDTLRARLA